MSKLHNEFPIELRHNIFSDSSTASFMNFISRNMLDLLRLIIIIIIIYVL